MGDCSVNLQLKIGGVADTFVCLIFSQTRHSLKEKTIMRKLFPLFALLVVASILLVACGTPSAPTPVTVEVTRIVTAEGSTVIDTPAAPAATDATPTAAAAPVAGGE